MDFKNILAKFDAVDNRANAKTTAQPAKKAAMLSILESFDRVAEAAKPDFLDIDKDGDKKEPMKKAAKEKDDDVKESKYPWLDHPNRPGAKKDKDDKDKDKELEEANHIGDTFMKHLKIKYNDKTSLSDSEKREVQNLVKRMSNDDKKKLAAASIRHVSDAAKDYIKRYIPSNMKEEVDLEEAIMVSAEGDEAEALLQILKLSGMPMPPAPAALPAPMAEPAADLDTMDIEMQDEYSNSPDEFEQDVSAVIANGTDLHREKGQYPAAARGDNPMNAFEGKFKAIMADLLKE
jgi:hypothetical protein